MKKTSLVALMPVGREHININFRIEDFINHSMLLCNGATPLPTAVSLQRFRVACVSFWMLFQFLNKFVSLLPVYGNKKTDYVYILTNPSFREDWVKKGKSSRLVDLRSKGAVLFETTDRI